MQRTFSLPIDRIRSARHAARHPDLSAFVARVPLAGRTVVDGMLHRILHEIGRNRPREQREDLREGLLAAMQAAAKPAALLEEFDALDTPWTPPARTGFEPASEVAATS